VLSHLLDGEPSSPVGLTVCHWALSGFRIQARPKSGYELILAFMAIPKSIAA
jgi:hypothetical protein